MRLDEMVFGKKYNIYISDCCINAVIGPVVYSGVKDLEEACVGKAVYIFDNGGIEIDGYDSSVKVEEAKEGSDG